MLAPEYSANGHTSSSSMDRDNPEIDDHSEQRLIEQKHPMDLESDRWPVYHSCYFHMRMYGEADYLMITDLKSEAKGRLCAALKNFPDKESFAEVIKELYSSGAKYDELKELAIEVIVNNQPDLLKGFTPVIDSSLLKSVPAFASDLFLPTAEKYVEAPSNMKPYPFATGFHLNGSDYKYVRMAN